MHQASDHARCLSFRTGKRVFSKLLTGERVDAGREAVLHAGSKPRTALNPAAAAVLGSFLGHIFHTGPTRPSRSCLGLLLLPVHWMGAGSGLRICGTRRS